MAVSIRINGRPDTVEAPTTIAAILEARRLRPEVVLVQVNRQLVRSGEFAEREIADGDVVDIVLQLAGGQGDAA